jgi:hypothetical protein
MSHSCKYRFYQNSKANTFDFLVTIVFILYVKLNIGHDSEANLAKHGSFRCLDSCVHPFFIGSCVKGSTRHNPN